MTDELLPVGGVLCAGFGSRMAPITEIIPKPLIPFLNTPLLAYGLDHLSRCGVKQVGMNLHHLADSVPPVADRLAQTMGMKPVYAREWEILGTAGGARGIWQALGAPAQTLILLNGDSVMNIDLGAHLRAHRESGARATLVVRPRASDQPGGVWVSEEERRLCGLRDFRHPDTPATLGEYDFTGVHFIEPELLCEIPLEKGCLVGDVYGPLLQEGEHFNISVNEDFWAALDTPQLYFETTCRVLDDPTLFQQVPLPQPLGEGLFVFAQEGVNDKTQLAGPLLLGAHVKTAAGVKVGPYSVVDGVDAQPGTSIRDAVLYGMGPIEGEWQRCLGVAGKVVNFPEG